MRVWIKCGSSNFELCSQFNEEISWSAVRTTSWLYLWILVKCKQTLLLFQPKSLYKSNAVSYLFISVIDWNAQHAHSCNVQQFEFFETKLHIYKIIFNPFFILNAVAMLLKIVRQCTRTLYSSMQNISRAKVSFFHLCSDQ